MMRRPTAPAAASSTDDTITRTAATRAGLVRARGLSRSQPATPADGAVGPAPVRLPSSQAAAAPVTAGPAPARISGQSRPSAYPNQAPESLANMPAVRSASPY